MMACEKCGGIASQVGDGCVCNGWMYVAMIIAGALLGIWLGVQQ